MKMDIKLIESDVKLICSDGELCYSRILFFLMEPTYKSLLLEECMREDLVIIIPSTSVNEVVNFYDESLITGVVEVTGGEKEEVCQNSNSPEVSTTTTVKAANTANTANKDIAAGRESLMILLSLRESSREKGHLKSKEGGGAMP